METTAEKPRDIIRVAVIGPESTGKSTLAKQLASHYKTEWVREYAREYLNARNGKYNEEDLLTIAKGQTALEAKLEKNANHILICDTELITIQIWSEYKYGTCDPWILHEIQNRKYDLYLLCTPDIPWEADSLRENSNEREYLYTIYKNKLLTNDFPFVEIKGEKTTRRQTANTAIEKLLNPLRQNRS